MPSLTHLEQPTCDITCVGGNYRQLISLFLDEVDAFPSEEDLPRNLPANAPEIFSDVLEATRRFGCGTVVELDPASITLFAGILGLVDPRPSLGPF